MSLDIIPSLLVNGVLLGTFYALMASGLALIYGVMRVINIAHGGIIMLGAYFSYVMLTYFGFDPLLSFIIAIPFFFPLGMLIQRYLLAPISRAPPVTSLLLLFGVWLVMQNLSFIAFSADIQFIAGRLPYSRIIFDGFPFTRILASLVSVGMVVTLYIFLSRTKMGKAIRAVAQDREVTSMLGVDVGRISAFAFGLGTSLAATSGALASTLFPFDPTFGGTFLLKAFVIIILGGMESVVGMALGGLVIGLAESVAGFYLRFAIVDAISFALFLTIMIIRPAGFFGRFRV